MGFIATQIGDIPAGGYEWYIILLEDSFQDLLRDTLDKNFQTLAEEVGTEVLVVKGIKPEVFYQDEFTTNVLQDDLDNLPALLIISEHPGLIDWERINQSTQRSPEVIFFTIIRVRRTGTNPGEFFSEAR